MASAVIIVSELATWSRGVGTRVALTTISELPAVLFVVSPRAIPVAINPHATAPATICLPFMRLPPAARLFGLSAAQQQKSLRTPQAESEGFSRLKITICSLTAKEWRRPYAVAVMWREATSSGFRRRAYSPAFPRASGVVSGIS
jgi:hypothetical protein